VADQLRRHLGAAFQFQTNDAYNFRAIRIFRGLFRKQGRSKYISNYPYGAARHRPNKARPTRRDLLVFHAHPNLRAILRPPPNHPPPRPPALHALGQQMHALPNPRDADPKTNPLPPLHLQLNPLLHNVHPDLLPLRLQPFLHNLPKRLSQLRAPRPRQRAQHLRPLLHARPPSQCLIPPNDHNLWP
jgi:hypothetical protein